MQHHGFEVLKEAEVRDIGDGVAGEVEVLQVDILPKMDILSNSKFC